MRFLCGLAFVVAVLVSTTAQAPYTNGVVKIGVLTDMSSVYSDIGGSGSVAAAKLAVEDFSPAAHGIVAFDPQRPAGTANRPCPTSGTFDLWSS